jgi:glutaredoxin
MVKTKIPKCHACHELLTDDNWTPGMKKRDSRTCKFCKKTKNIRYNALNKQRLHDHHKILYQNDREKRVEYQVKYDSEHKTAIREYQKNHQVEPRDYVLPIRDCMRLNDKFDNSQFHHISRSIGVYIPTVLHKHIYHNMKNGANLGEMNLLALQYVYGEF